jgi:hypothetical protein
MNQITNPNSLISKKFVKKKSFQPTQAFQIFCEIFSKVAFSI